MEQIKSAIRGEHPFCVVVTHEEEEEEEKWKSRLHRYRLVSKWRDTGRGLRCECAKIKLDSVCCRLLYDYYYILCHCPVAFCRLYKLNPLTLCLSLIQIDCILHVMHVHQMLFSVPYLLTAMSPPHQFSRRRFHDRRETSPPFFK